MRRTLLLLLFAALPLEAKSLYWKSLDVRARLDRDGNLHTIERQAIVFDGDWNGGERKFNVRLGQSLHLENIVRIDPLTGARFPMQRGDLSKVDHYSRGKEDLVRWRSRLPSDPSFSNTMLVYELDYTIDNVLIPDRDVYRLNHAFAFPDRAGVIEHFTLQLALAPEFQPLIPTPLHWNASNLPPGESFGVRLPLRFTGAGTPASVRGASPLARWAIVVLLLLAGTVLMNAFHVREKERGSFEPLPNVAVDDAWLAANLFAMPPEVAGAAWDNSTGSAEVVGLLARLVQEGKLSSTIDRNGTLIKHDVLHLKLLVDRKQLHDYESKLLSAFFFDGRTEVSTDEIREHYKTSGFDPASKIRGGVEKQVKRLIGGDAKTTRFRGLFSIPAFIAMWVAALALVVFACILDVVNVVVAVVFVVAGTLLLVVPSLFLCVRLAKAVSKRPWQVFVAIAPVLVYALAIATFALVPVLPFHHPGVLLLLGLVVLFTAVLATVLVNAMSTDSLERLAIRRNLTVAREFFRQQLKLQNPQLNDRWYPYLLAFGLGENVDRWFRSFGANAVASSTNTFAAGRSSSSSSSSTSSSSWTGGGGAFGGAGASGAWAVAAGSMAVGVSSAASGGGGGGGGGFSSGGGGGGGW